VAECLEQAGRLRDALVPRRGAVAVGERRKPLEVVGALFREGVPEVVEVVLDRVPLADRPQLLRQIGLGVLDVADRFVEFQRSASVVSLTPSPPAVAATPSATGSEAVVVGAGAATPSAPAIFSTRTAAILKSG